MITVSDVSPSAPLLTKGFYPLNLPIPIFHVVSNEMF